MGGEFFQCTGQCVTFEGFTSIMPWLAINEKNLPQFTKGEKIEVSKVNLHEVVFLLYDLSTRIFMYLICGLLS